MTREQRDELTTAIYGAVKALDLWSPKMCLVAYCHRYQHEPIECGEVYSDLWHVKVFDDGTFQIGWLEYRNGTTLVTKNVADIAEVYQFLAKQR